MAQIQNHTLLYYLREFITAIIATNDAEIKAVNEGIKRQREETWALLRKKNEEGQGGWNKFGPRPGTEKNVTPFINWTWAVKK